MFTCVLVYLYTCVLVYLCACEIVYLWNCVIVSLWTCLCVSTSVETFRLLQNLVISDVWKYLAVIVDLFSLNNSFPMSIIRSGFSTNLMHFCNVMSRPKKIQRKYYYYYLKDRQISRVVRTPSCNENLYILCQSPRPAHGGQPSVGSLQPTAHGGPFRIGFPYPVGSDKLILSIYSHRHIPSLSFSIYLRTNLCVYLIKCVLVYLCTCVLV